MDITDAAAPKSDQINADDLMSGPRVVTITDVRQGSSEQPVEIITAEFGDGRPYRPGKSMIRVLINAWGPEASTYKGRRLEIYREPEITFGRDKVGGIRIKAMSHIEKRITLALTVTRGKRAPFVVEPLADAPSQIPTDLADKVNAAEDASWLNKTSAYLRKFVASEPDRVAELQALIAARISALYSDPNEPAPDTQPTPEGE